MKAQSVSIVMVIAALACGSAEAAGPVTLTQGKATKGAVTPGDAPGFPITISKPGSYILAGNLTVPNANTTAIEIASDHVTLDLGGYAILGPVDCSGGTNPCAGAGSGDGILTAGVRFNITIRNGTIQGLGRDGIRIDGDSQLVEYIHARSNGQDGIIIGDSADSGGSIAQFNTAQRNGGQGIVLSKGIARNNVADVNGTLGIWVTNGVATGNVVTRNGEWGLAFDSQRVAYFDNVMDANGTAPVRSGTNLGRNLCNGAPC